MTAFLHAVGTATPAHDIHDEYLAWARSRVSGDRERRVFDRMAARAGIERRWSVLPAAGSFAAKGFYGDALFPGTAARMAIYAEQAPALGVQAIEQLGDRAQLDGVTHLVVASCTGFVAPGIDQIIARRLGLSPSVERLLIGFMGCYAGVAALRTARHLVRSDPAARVLAVCVELCTLHLQDTPELESLLGQMQFGDGAAAALVTGEPGGFELGAPFSTTLPDSHDLIRWDITDRGFAMHLSGEVPGRIAAALADEAFAHAATGGASADAIRNWAVHAGGRSILDAVEGALRLPPTALAPSRGVLAEAGNMSSATLLFVFQRLLERPEGDGVALAFGPGLAAEGFSFRGAAR